MSNTIVFPSKSICSKYSFISRLTDYRDDNGTIRKFPSIILVHNNTKLVVCYTGLERYLLSLVHDEQKANSSLNQRGQAVCSFLNYVLHNVSISSLNELSLNDIRRYFVSLKETDIMKGTWERYLSHIVTFLINYYEANKCNSIFLFDWNCLCEPELRIAKNGRVYLGKKYSGLDLKAPINDQRKKNRLLPYSYLEILIRAADMYDPEISLFIQLQAYAGLRESEPVHLTYERYKEIGGGLSGISSIELDLSSPADFWKDYKVNPGRIKKYRPQKVYDDFLISIRNAFNYHRALMARKGYPIGPKDPVFRNKHGNPLTAGAYSARLKSLFYNHFLPMLKQFAEASGEYEVHAPIIELYQQGYPGAHMLRHWFTMYLFKEAKLKPSEISSWRGDKSESSMVDYIHIYGEMMEEYSKAIYALQDRMWNSFNDRLDKE